MMPSLSSFVSTVKRFGLLVLAMLVTTTALTISTPAYCILRAGARLARELRDLAGDHDIGLARFGPAGSPREWSRRAGAGHL